LFFFAQIGQKECGQKGRQKGRHKREGGRGGDRGVGTGACADPGRQAVRDAGGAGERRAH